MSSVCFVLPITNSPAGTSHHTMSGRPSFTPTPARGSPTQFSAFPAALRSCTGAFRLVATPTSVSCTLRIVASFGCAPPLSAMQRAASGGFTGSSASTNRGHVRQDARQQHRRLLPARRFDPALWPIPAQVVAGLETTLPGRAPRSTPGPTGGRSAPGRRSGQAGVALAQR